MSANDTQIGGSHYQTNKALRGVEHWDWCYHNGYDIFQTYISKYVHRHREKNGIEDLKKARHTLDKYIEVLEAEQKHQHLDDLKAAEEAQCSPPPIPKDLTELWEAPRLAEDTPVSVSGVPYKVATKDLEKSSITPVITITVEDERDAEMFDGDIILKVIKENSEEIKDQILRGKVRAREEAWRGEKPQE